jgi:lipopolysaccharide/colanic/teichoic acid biosynthesis glycosyltransferase
MKRLFDLSLSAMGLLVSLPLWALIAVSIKLEDGGPVFYGQERVGKGGRRFKLWKFRSMTPHTGRQCVRQAVCNDKRITSVGRFIRARAMDEWPQLWNIFKGDMSFVGPRPLLPEEIEVHCPDQIVGLEDIPGYEARHQVSPGLTGLAQIFAPRDLPRRQKFRLDLLYIKKQSFRIDMWFIALSFWITFRGKCGQPWVRRQSVRKTRHTAPAYALNWRYSPSRLENGVVALFTYFFG